MESAAKFWHSKCQVSNSLQLPPNFLVRSDGEEVRAPHYYRPGRGNSAAASNGPCEAAIISNLNPNPLRYTKRLSRRFLFLELGKLSSALEEIEIGAPEIGERLLQHLRIEVVEPQFRLLELGELGR
jgi:hypothetical protein